MQWLTALVRPDLLGMAPYSSARLEGNEDTVIALNANESPLPPFSDLSGQLQLNRYPDPQPQQLKARLAAWYGVEADGIYVGRGSDEGIDLLIRLFCKAGKDSILICPPTFGMYEIYARVQNAGVIEVPLQSTDRQLDMPAIAKACMPQTKLVFIPSPNAPMGHAIARGSVLALCARLKGKALVVIDEAYAEFSAAPQGFAQDLADNENLVLLRTLSKAHALAGERLGCVLAAPAIIAWLRKIGAPYPLSQSSIHAGLQALSPVGLAHQQNVNRIIRAERERLLVALGNSDKIKTIYPSEANFLLLETTDAAAFMAQLARFGIRARDRSTVVPGAVRLTIGTPQENDAVLRALDLEADEKTPQQRFASLRRATNETDIEVSINLDAVSVISIETGIGFFDHMLEQVAKHGGFSLTLVCKGDLHVDAHHTVEDCALALGSALHQALGDKKGIARFAFTAPLDEAIAELVLDLSGRAFCKFDGLFPSEMIGELPSEMVPHFFMSLASSLKAALHVNVKGDNAHHMAEACFKALGRALRQAVAREGDELPSTKGLL